VISSRLAALAVALAVAVDAASVRAADADDRYARELGELVDRYRAQHGVGALEIDRSLSALAREHSMAMAKAARLSHEGFQSRFRRSGYGMCVENVGWNHHTPQAQLDAWRESAGHDRNMRDARVTHSGVGIASRYVTWIACR
jgi:uncharacterized protein YkwD